MSRQILVPVDGSPKSTAGLEYALSTYDADEITVLHVMSPHGLGAPDVDSGEFETWRERASEEAEEVLEDARDVANEHGREVSTALEVGEPWRAIVDYADEHDIDHVILGSHGRHEDSPLPLGSVAETVMRRSPVLVSIIK